MSEMSTKDKCAAVTALLKRGPRAEHTDEQVVDLVLKHGSAAAAARSIGKKPGNFYQRLRLALRRLETK